MKQFRFQIIAALVLAGGILSGCVCNTASTNKSYMIETKVPVRPAGQQDVVQLRTEPLSTVRVAFIGLGMRGPGAVYRMTNIPGVEIVALCDVV